MSDECCERHPELVAGSRCGHCGRGICRECIKEFGYYCSPACLEASKGQITDEDRESAEKAWEELATAAKTGRNIALCIAALLVFAGLVAVWKLFLDPVGKVCWRWEHSADLHTMRILGSRDGEVVVRSGQQIVTLQAKNGKILTESAVEGMGNSFDHIEPVGDGVLLVGASRVAVTRRDGSLAFTSDLPGVSSTWALGPDRKSAFFCVVPTKPAGVKNPKDEGKWLILCLELDNGKEVWRSKELGGTTAVRAIAAGREKVFIHLAKSTGAFKFEHVFWVLNGRDGAESWRIALPEAPTWGPRAWEDVCLLQLEDEIHAFAAAGKEIWSVSVPTSYCEKFLTDGVLLVASTGGTTCIDLATGKELWQTPVAVSEDASVVTPDGVFVLGVVADSAPDSGTDAQVKLPAAYEQNKDILKDFGINPGSMAKTQKLSPALLCLDRKTGKERWRTRGVVGELYGDRKRLVLLMDTSKTSMLQMVGGGKGVTVIRQYDPEDGSMLYSRQSELGLSTPRLVANRLIGIAYERTEQAGLLNGMSYESTGAESGNKAWGVVAFAVK